MVRSEPEVEGMIKAKRGERTARREESCEGRRQAGEPEEDRQIHLIVMRKQYLASLYRLQGSRGRTLKTAQGKTKQKLCENQSYGEGVVYRHLGHADLFSG